MTRQHKLETAATILAITIVILTAWMFAANPAQAFTELDNGRCQQSDGQLGVLNGTTLDDDGCITPVEYDQMWSVDNLVAVGVIDSAVLNDDGTTTVHYSLGGTNTIVSEPLDRPVAANPEIEPDAPTVRQVLYSGINTPA